MRNHYTISSPWNADCCFIFKQQAVYADHQCQITSQGSGAIAASKHNRQEHMLVTTQISSADFARFCEISEDRNPIHISAEAARTSPFGQNLVFGVQTALTALEAFCASADQTTARQFKSLSVYLPVPVYPDETITIKSSQRDEDTFLINCTIGTTTLVRIKLELTDKSQVMSSDDIEIGPLDYIREPLVRHLDQSLPVTGRLPLGSSVDPAFLFPKLCEQLGRMTVMSMIRLSTIVGMEWPGLYSVLTDFDIDFTGADPAVKGLEFSSNRVDPRVSMTWINARSSSIDAKMTAMFRPLPVFQPSFAEIRKSFRNDFASGRNCLVIGGSRGLGAVSAKAFAAAGGHPTITYFASPDRAEEVAREIRQGGGNCTIAALDVGDASALDNLLQGADPFQSMMYFATPHIFRRRTQGFSDEFFSDFINIYVSAFHRIVTSMVAATRSPLRALYPSTVAIDEPIKELTEYAAAKAAGESVCRTLQKQTKRLTIDIVRFPRIKTDQTNTIAAAVTTDPLDLLGPAIVRLCDIDKT